MITDEAQESERGLKQDDISMRKYKPGRQIYSVSQFDQSESKWFMWGDKTTHRSVLMSLQYRTLLNTIKNGRLREAVRIEETNGEEA